MTFFFGILAEIDVKISTLALTLTVVFLSCFDFLTRAIEFSVRNNQIYNKMLQKMYKELMTMGFVTLAVSLYTAADPSSVFARYSTEIDFVGYVTFFVAIFFVAHALYIMLLSMRTSRLYERLHRLKVAKSIEIYTKSQENWWEKILFEIPYLPFSSIRQKLEFKIIHSLFRDTYWLPTDFDYGSYLSRCFEKYSLKMINIGWSSWMVMIAFAFLNYLRVELLSIGVMSCDRGVSQNTTARRLFSLTTGDDVDAIPIVVFDEPFDGRVLEEVSHDCIRLNVAIFLVSGSALVIYAFLLYLTGMFYYGRLIERTGICCLSDYPKFLMFEESISLNVSGAERQQQQRQVELDFNDNFSKKSKRRMSINTLRSNVTTLLKEPQMQKEEKIFEKISQTIDSNVKRHRSLLKRTVSSFGKKISPLMKSKTMSRLKSLKSFGSMSSLVGEDVEDDKSIEEEDAANHVPLIYRVEEESSNVRHTLQVMAKQASSFKQKSMRNLNASFEGKKSSSGSEKDGQKPPTRRRNMVINLRKDDRGAGGDVDSLTSIEQFKLFKLKEKDEKSIKQSEKRTQGIMMSYLQHHSNAAKGGNSHMKLSEDLSDIYFFRNPDLYNKAVEYAIMLNSMYLSLWACNFITVVRENFDEDAWTFHTFMLVPLLFVLPLLGEIVKVSSLLEAIADLDLDVIGAVLEEMEEKNQLVVELRGKILSRLVGEMADKREVVKRLFCEIDIDKNGHITIAEMKQMLRALKLHYSDAKFLRLYNAIDDDLNGSISELELTLLIFPDMTEDDDIKRRRLKLRQTSREIDKRRMSTKFRPRMFSVLTKYAHVSPLAPQKSFPHGNSEVLEQISSIKEGILPSNSGDIKVQSDGESSSDSDSDSEEGVESNGECDVMRSDDGSEEKDSMPSRSPKQSPPFGRSPEANGRPPRPQFGRGRSNEHTSNEYTDRGVAGAQNDENPASDDGGFRSRTATITDGPPLEFDDDAYTSGGQDTSRKERGRARTTTTEAPAPVGDFSSPPARGDDRIRGRSSSSVESFKPDVQEHAHEEGGNIRDIGGSGGSGIGHIQSSPTRARARTTSSGPLDIIDDF